jgi:hypothetical protein
MPVIDLGEWPDKRELSGIHRFWSTMLFPDVQEKRDKLIFLVFPLPFFR